MIFAPRSDNGQIPYERYHLYGKLQSRPLLSEFFKDLIVMDFALFVPDNETKLIYSCFTLFS